MVREAIENPEIFASDEEVLRVAEAARVLLRPTEFVTVKSGRAFRGPALARIGAAERKKRKKQNKEAARARSDA